MTSNMTHQGYGSSTNETRSIADNPSNENQLVRRSTSDEVRFAEETYNWGAPIYDVPYLLPEDDWNLDFDANEGSNMESIQFIAAGSLVYPGNYQDDSTILDDDTATQDDSQRTVTRKRRYVDAEETFHKVHKNANVGPDAPQMTGLKRILRYLEEAVDEDPQLLDRVREVVHHCETRHRRGENKYQHLPGAIFEMLVDTIGGPTFGRLSAKSKDYHDNRIQFKQEDDESEQLIVHANPPFRPVEVQTPGRSLLSTAVAYGFHLAVVNKKEGRNSLGENEVDVEKAIHDGEHAVSSMDNAVRNKFWEHFHNCDCLSDKQK